MIYLYIISQSIPALVIDLMYAYLSGSQYIHHHHQSPNPPTLIGDLDSRVEGRGHEGVAQCHVEGRPVLVVAGPHQVVQPILLGGWGGVRVLCVGLACGVGVWVGSVCRRTAAPGRTVFWLGLGFVFVGFRDRFDLS